MSSVASSNAPVADRLRQWDWEAIRLSLYSKTAVDVERALAKPQLDQGDIQALLSPAAADYLEPMAQRAYALTRQRFGQAIQMYIPLYLSNLCSNECSYCGFSVNQPIRRLALSAEQIVREGAAIRSRGYQHLLLVSGEAETKVGAAYFRQALQLLRPQFAQLSLEVQPLTTAEYQMLVEEGLHAVLVYQETYKRAVYARHHLRGKKQDFDWRLETPDRLGQAGVSKIGVGALLGLADWRTDSWFTLQHVRLLEQTYWRSRYSISFPRLRPCSSNREQFSGMSERELVQLICACRIACPQAELSLSTRESAAFRDQVLPLGITSMSAESSTQPGGYAEQDARLEQFRIDDTRSTAQVAAAIRARGFQPVWKDWEPAFR
ncbi:2-iminoacetate synthase ThiH [Plesiomonas shigelloides]|uniref:2-iminoacetate synthase ThiH n=1 Tax=Plesiomonas shigelloides TaxID=703 RepID=UPI001C05E1FD|nr:2-iminoacetate synthase ThiH [Plesiomonas shigelloides]QWK97094.1 2-iminoacetate synthase ThiH [Plesiomonas shigelloides]